MLNKGCGASVGFKAFDVECVFGVRVFLQKNQATPRNNVAAYSGVYR